MAHPPNPTLWPPAAHPPVRNRAPSFWTRNRDYFWGVANALQSSSLLPMPWRRRLLGLFGCRIDRTSEVREGVFFGGNQVTIERHCYVNTGCFIDGCAPVHIGEFVRFGPGVRILTGSHSYQHSVIRRGPASDDIRLPVVVGRGCWLGMGAILMPGVVLAEGCVVAAGAVVLRSTAPNGLYAGNPARRVRDLPT
jgi:maltose O-acetyltransferase